MTLARLPLAARARLLVSARGLRAGIRAPAVAQERIELLTFVNNQSHMVEVDASVTGFGAVRAVTPVPNGLEPTSSGLGPPEGLAAVAGGRYIAWVTHASSSRSGRSSPSTAGRGPSSMRPACCQGTPLACRASPTSASPRATRIGRGSSSPATIRPPQMWAIDLQGRPPVLLGASQLG